MQSNDTYVFGDKQIVHALNSRIIASSITRTFGLQLYAIALFTSMIAMMTVDAYINKIDILQDEARPTLLITSSCALAYLLCYLLIRLVRQHLFLSQGGPQPSKIVAVKESENDEHTFWSIEIRTDDDEQGLTIKFSAPLGRYQPPPVGTRVTLLRLNSGVVMAV